MEKERKRSTGSILLRILFLLYVAAMAWLLFGQRWGTELYRSINWKPFVTMKLYWKLLQGSNAYLVRHAFINLVGNVVMFVPLGFFQPYLIAGLRKWYKTMLTTTALILLVEVVQYVTLLGSCDVDDLILNLLGAWLGYILWRITRRK